MRTIILLIGFSLFYQICAAQHDDLYEKMYQFHLLTGGSKVKETNSDYSKLLFLEDVLLKDTAFSNDFGIYKFMLYVTEGENYNIIIKKGEKIEFYDMANLNFVIKNVLSLKDSISDLNNDVMVRYIEEISNIYDDNNRWRTDETMFKYQFGNYHFYISFDNYVRKKD